MFSVSSYLRAPPGCTSSSYRAPVGASASQQRLEGLEPPNIRFANDQSGNAIPDRSSLPLLPSVQILFCSFCGKCPENRELIEALNFAAAPRGVSDASGRCKQRPSKLFAGGRFFRASKQY